jgi:ubiquilin
MCLCGKHCLLPLQGLGGMNMANPEQMQQAMSQMMNNPMMQSVLNDPEMLRNMFSSNPAIQQVCASSQILH